MSKLPLKLQVGIRDHWTATSSPVQKAIQNLQEVLGITITINPEWPLLLNELDAFYPDKAILVPAVAGAVEAWCTALTTLADDEANAEWADMLLERTKSRIRLFIEVSKNREMGMTYSHQQTGFILSLPKSSAPSQSYMQSFFTGTLINCFSAKSKPSSSPSNAESGAVDDWADVSVDKSTGTAAIVDSLQRHIPTQLQQQRQQESPQFDTIPDVNTISRPDELLLKPPYHLTVYAINKTLAEVQCSHSPTLQFLSDYLQKWSKTNHNNTTRPPCAEVKLYQSAFGLGVVYDRLTVSSESRYFDQAVSATMLLALIEGVLGYKNVSVDGSSWTYRRDVEFKSGRY
ncbi:hypothetical protein HD806DRAFT_250876 [Xylariaceae sp. AK1471]|nr:hypothetical protein HD806DRAFT_250876 [Xylariaceae sp. AK1471]